MATASTASPWSDAALRTTSHNSAGRRYTSLGGTKAARLSSPLTPVSIGDRKVSGKRKRDSGAEGATLTTPYIVVGKDTPALLGVSPSPLVNERYRLAHGEETPSMSTAVMTMRLGDTPDLSAYRSTWTSEESRGHQGIMLGKEGNGRARMPLHNERRSWTMGGMMGKVFGFCYSMLPALPTDAPPMGDDFDTWRRLATPLPGMYPEDERDTSASPVRPAKRLHTGTRSSDWVFVDEAAQLSPHMPTCASRASSRRPTAPRSRKSIAAQTVTPTGSPSSAAGHRRRVSVASTRASLRSRRSATSLRLEAEEEQRSNLSPEAQRWVARKERRDRDADKSMRKMSRQVQDLIRQGQMALGSRVEVEGEFEDSDREE
ncbi:hypothetical protein K461DRAFT_279782 [Myriangium duriaei CBS 260.36]|uniref:Uncharacterized protein n=1 Tax=Myriangium duriaei CBS 260.36 TaxID=1168546 RepID=A0A9P4MIG5_9PEZI|nr:hypothetical protein K461DRAFT_279782 [Myriangium duriaei CBS 260.36]